MVTMPQLVKGGKYVFGWSKVGTNGKIMIPNEAVEEYRLMKYETGILIPGSKTSGGFGLSALDSLKQSPLGDLIKEHTRALSEGNMIEVKGKIYSRVKIHRDGSITVPVEILEKYGIKPGDHILSVRGSNFALGFIVRGPIIDEARKHPDIREFE